MSRRFWRARSGSAKPVARSATRLGSFEPRRRGAGRSPKNAAKARCTARVIARWRRAEGPGGGGRRAGDAERAGPGGPAPPASLGQRVGLELVEELQPVLDGAQVHVARDSAGRGRALLARRRGGLTLLAGLLGGTLLIELVLPLADRFTHYRYDQFGLPFVFVAMGCAIVAFAKQLARWNRYSGIATGGLLAAAIVATSATGLVGYAQHGRPDWPAMARAVVAVDGLNAEVAVPVPWVQISLGYYLGRYDRWPQEPPGIVLLMNDRARLAQVIGSRAGCHLVLVAGHPRDRELLHGF